MEDFCLGRLSEMKEELRKEEVAEDSCFVCKDGGNLLICEHGNCLKVYHPHCVGKDESFLEGQESWSCSWHTCFLCHESSKYRCFCCPKAWCEDCIEAAEFIRVRKSKGFCRDCLELLILNKDNESHAVTQGKLELSRSENNELFMEYWQQVRKLKRISSKELQDAETLLKKRYSHKISSTRYQSINEKRTVMSKDQWVSKIKVRHERSSKRVGGRKRIFKGWASVELFKFLTSLGKDTTQALDPLDVHQIVVEYIRENGLFLSKAKRKTILCDSKLHSLFGKVKIKISKIDNLLECHFATDAAQDIFSLDSGKDSSDNEYQLDKGISPGRTDREQIVRFALMVPRNLKLVYLRKSLVVELLNDLQMFARKVIGCYVRIKNNGEYIDFSSDKAFVLLKISGTDADSELYTVGGASTKIVLRAHKCSKNINISLLSDDDLQEGECEDLRQLVENGSLERPTVEEFEEQCRIVHQDIVNHGIKRELMILQRKIEIANEKGQSREKMELIRRRALLQTCGERDRRMSDIPKILCDVEKVGKNGKGPTCV